MATPDPDPPAVLTDDALNELRARCARLREEGWAQEALRLLETLPPHPVTALLRAQALNDLGRHEEALTACAEAFPTDAASLPGSTSPEPFAPDSPMDAVRFQPGAPCPSPDAYLNEVRFIQGFTLLMLQRWEEALAALDALLADAPDFPDAAWVRAGLLRQLRGELDPAVLAAFDLALQIDPGNRYARVERADLLRVQGRYEEARDVYAVVRSDCPDEALRVEATFKLGCVALVLQENECSREAFQAVLDIVPDYPDAQAMLDLVRTEQRS